MKKKTVKAIVFADRRGEELLPLTETLCVALLPVAAKPLIEHTLDALSVAQIHEVMVVISATDAPQIKAALGTGERFGVEINYILSQGQDHPATVLSNLNQPLEEPEYLLVRGDFLHSLKINDFLEQSGKIATTTHTVAIVDGNFSGICLWRRLASSGAWLDSEILHWTPQNFSQQPTFLSPFHPIAVSGRLSLLDSLPGYHRANLEVLANHFPTLTLPGYRMTQQLFVGHRSHNVPPQTSGIIGRWCHVHPKACLHQVILGDGVIVDQHAELNNTVVFPYTYIGKSVKLQNAIVWGNRWIPLDSETIALHIVHDLSLADLKKQSLKAIIINGINRLLSWVRPVK